MKYNLYAVHDQAVKEFIGPEVARTHGEAERKFVNNVNDERMGLLHTNPEHFSLHHVGYIESETGKITGLPEPLHIMSAIQAKKEERT